VIKTIFDAAVQVTNVYMLSAFVAATVLVIIYLVVRDKRKPVPFMAWVVLCVAIIVPSLGGLVIMFVPDPLYRLRITVIDSENRSVNNARVSTVPFGVTKQVGSAWEVEIAKATVSQGGAVQIRAEADSADGLLIGTEQRTLDSDSQVDVTVVLQAQRNARIAGIVVDNVGRAIANAKISVIGHGDEFDTTDGNGSFDLDAHVARAQPVQLHTEADGFLPDNQTYLAGGRVTVTLKPAPKSPKKRR
jgi:hypothetical protein